MHAAGKIFLAHSSPCYFPVFWGALSHSRAKRCLQPLLRSSYPCGLLGSRDNPPHSGDEECWEMVPQPLGQRVTLESGVAAGSGDNPGFNRQLCQAPPWWPRLGCCSTLRAEPGAPRVSRDCDDCSACSVGLPAGHGAGAEHCLSGYVKGIQSCQGAKAVGVRVGTNKGRRLDDPCGSLPAWNIP